MTYLYGIVKYPEIQYVSLNEHNLQDNVWSIQL